jgi:hypothetical protein
VSGGRSKPNTVKPCIWVVSTYALIFVLPFSVGGKWVVAVVAELLLAFATLQWLGIRRIYFHAAAAVRGLRWGRCMTNFRSGKLLP